MIRSVSIVKNTRKYKYLFVIKIGLILIAMTAGFVFLCVYIHGYVLWELRLLIAIKLCPWILSADIFIQNMIRSYFICNQKCISTFGFLLLLVEVNLSKYADIQFVESETVMNYISFSSVLWRISMLVKFIIYYLTKTYWRFTSNFQVITFPRRIKW